MKRNIIHIDEEKCDGCGQCVDACAEGAIQIIDGKARLVSETYCDGLGACIGECPQDAITLEQRDAPDFDAAAVEEHLAAIGQGSTAAVGGAGMSAAGGAHAAETRAAGDAKTGCPSCQVLDFSEGETEEPARAVGTDSPAARMPTTDVAPGPTPATATASPSALRQWPVQIHLVPPNAPYLQGADILLAADCVPFAFADFHRDLLAGKALLIGCPKLDDTAAYVAKLTDMFRANDIHGVTVARMEVGCCVGLVYAAQEAIKASGKEIPFEEVVIGIRGEKHAPQPARVRA